LGLVYEGPSLAFGRRRPRRYNVPGSPCNKLRKRVCRSNPNCVYAKRRGCRRRNGTKTLGLVYEGPSLAFGRRRPRRASKRRASKRRYNVPGSPCNKLRRRVCRSSPNCTYVKGRGCRRRNGTRGGMIFEGPSLPSGPYTVSDAEIAAKEAAELMFGRRRRSRR